MEVGFSETGLNHTDNADERKQLRLDFDGFFAVLNPGGARKVPSRYIGSCQHE
jgi:hypothetical protein